MPDRLAKGTRVEIHGIVLPAGERAPQVPEDTARVPLEMRAKGFLVEPTELGSEAEITTATGRRLRGAVMVANPPYDHGFGEPLPELLKIGREARAILHAQDKAK